MKIPFAKVDCSGNEAKYVTEVLSSGWLTTASKTKRLESCFRNYIGCKHALAVNSCTSGLHLALDALGVSAGDSVFVPAMTFTASAEVIRYMGAHPVLIDVDADTSAISVEILKRAIKRNPDVKVLIAVHFGGLALPMLGDNGLLELCKKNGIRIIEDAAHALPSYYNSTLVGNFGDITCFSFYANKTMTTGEGGMVVTNNDELASRITLMRLHGIDRDVWDRFTTKSATWEYDVVAAGYKYNMPDLNAAVGLAQIERLNEMHQARVNCAELYFELLRDIEELKLPFRPADLPSHSWHLFPIRLRIPDISRRNLIMEKFNQDGIGVSVHYKPIHRLTYYRKKYDLNVGEFQQSEDIWCSTISLPIYNLLTSVEVRHICERLVQHLK